MYLQHALKVKRALCRSEGPFNDFDNPCSHYLRVKTGAREFIIRGIKDALKVVEVGLGPNRIGFKTVHESARLEDIKAFLDLAHMREIVPID